MFISREEKQHRLNQLKPVKTVIISFGLCIFLLFSLSIWNFASFLKTSVPRSPVCTMMAWRKKTAAGSRGFLFRFQGHIPPTDYKQSKSKLLQNFNAIQSLDGSWQVERQRIAEAADKRWQDIDLLLTFLKAIVFEVTQFFHLLCVLCSAEFCLEDYSTESRAALTKWRRQKQGQVKELEMHWGHKNTKRQSVSSQHRELIVNI